MQIILTLLILLSLGLFILGLFSPTLSLFWFQGERTRKKSNIIYLLLFLFLAFLFGKIIQSEIKNLPPTQNVTQSKKPNDKPYDFNNVDGIIEKMNKIGIGQFSKWKTDMDNGFQSITPYYEYGETSPKINMKCNLAGYLTSKDESKIEEFVMVLNINNPAVKTKALERMSLSIANLLETLNIKNEEIIKDVKIGKEFEFNNQFNSITFKLVKSKIETYNFKLKDN